MTKKAFDNIVVLDMTRYLPGGYSTQVFADLGAEVIKVEDTNITNTFDDKRINIFCIAFILSLFAANFGFQRCHSFIHLASLKTT